MPSEHVLRMTAVLLLALVVLPQGSSLPKGPSCFLRSNGTQCLASEDANGPCTWTLCTPSDPCSANWPQEGVCHDAISIFLKLLQETQKNVDQESESLRKKSAQVMRLCESFQNETPETVKVSSSDLDIRQSSKQDSLSASLPLASTSSTFPPVASSALLSTASRVRRLKDGQNDCMLAKSALNLQKEMHDKESAAVSTTLKILHGNNILKNLQELAKSFKAEPDREVMESANLMETLSQIAPHTQLADTTMATQSSSDDFTSAAYMLPKHAALREDETITDEAKSGCMENIQKEEEAKQEIGIALLNVSSSIVALSDNIGTLEGEIKALDQSISANAEWLAERPAFHHKRHAEFLKVSTLLASATDIVTRALTVLQEFYGSAPNIDSSEIHSKPSLLRGEPQIVPGGIATILSIPTKYTKQNCSIVQRLMQRFNALLVTRTDEAKKREHDADVKSQRSEGNAKMAKVADEKSLATKKHAKFILESQLVERKKQRVQLAEDQRNINLRLLQLHHDCDTMSHNIDSSIMAARRGEDSIRTESPLPHKVAWINAHQGLETWKIVFAFFLLSIVLALLLFPIISMFGTLFQCSVVAFFMPRHQKSLPNSQIYSVFSGDEHLGYNHLG